MKILRGEALARHTTFRVGGPARRYVILQRRDIADLLSPASVDADREDANKETPGGNSAPSLPPPPPGKRRGFLLLGRGSNIVAPDEGFDGTVIDTTRLTGISLQRQGERCTITALAGTGSSRLAGFAAQNSLTGLEFLRGLPGTIGGAVFMNARCYGREIADCLESVRYTDEDGALYELRCKKEQFDYKLSPFRKQGIIPDGVKISVPPYYRRLPLRLILSVTLRAASGDRAQIQRTMEGYTEDRKRKGHYLYPCAGSVFKNNRDSGKPAGKIIEELGLRGTQIGGARIADWHGNFIINTGNATAADIRALARLVQEEAEKRMNIRLECEIIFLSP